MMRFKNKVSNFKEQLLKLISRIISRKKSSLNYHCIKILNTPFDETYISLRNKLDVLGKKLFDLIGIQLDVEHYYADSWERGATLDTIDNNVSDRAYLKEKLTYALTLDETAKTSYITRLINRNNTDTDEIYYSVALHGLNTLGIKQDGEVYMDIQGDRPYTKETPIPMSMTKLYDNYTLKAKFGGFKPETDYTLTIVYKSDASADAKHRITANSHIIYEGAQFGGEKNPQFDKDFLVPGFESATYNLKSDIFVNGTLELEISEPDIGFKFCEMWIKKA
jgi:hypothetical protein